MGTRRPRVGPVAGEGTTGWSASNTSASGCGAASLSRLSAWRDAGAVVGWTGRALSRACCSCSGEQRRCSGASLRIWRRSWATWGEGWMARSLGRCQRQRGRWSRPGDASSSLYFPSRNGLCRRRGQRAVSSGSRVSHATHHIHAHFYPVDFDGGFIVVFESCPGQDASDSGAASLGSHSAAWLYIFGCCCPGHCAGQGACATDSRADTLSAVADRTARAPAAAREARPAPSTRLDPHHR